MARGLFVEKLMSEESLQNLVLKSDIEQASKFGSSRRRCEFLTWRSIIYRELGLGVDITYNSVGAPIISNVEGIYISVSHCLSHVAVVISSHQCTVDIESTSRNFDKIKSRYISNRELQLSNDLLFSAIVWSAKEALYKLAGEQELDLIADICIKSFGGDTILGSIKGGDDISLSVDLLDDSQMVVVYLL